MPERAAMMGLRTVVVAVSAEAAWQMTGANLSSPQTAELNAHARAPTISKWVNMSTAEGIAFLGLLAYLAYLDGIGAQWVALGGLWGLGGMYLKYRYAIASGLESGAPPTERYGAAGLVLAG